MAAIPDTIIRTALAERTGTFVDKGGSSPSKTAIADFKVPVTKVDGSISYQFFTDPTEDEIAAVLARASGGDSMVTAAALDAVRREPNGLNAGAAKVLFQRAYARAAEGTKVTAATQALKQLEFRAGLASKVLTQREAKLSAGYNDLEQLRALHKHCQVTHPEEPVVAAIAQAFPNDALIAGAAAALQQRVFTLATGVAGRITAMEELSGKRRSRDGELKAVSFAERTTYIERAQRLIDAGWKFKVRPFKDAEEMTPAQLFAQLSQVGEIYVTHPTYAGTAAPRALSSVSELDEFLTIEAGA